MPITEAQINELSDSLSSFQRNIDSAKEDLDNLIKLDSFIVAKGDDLKDVSGGLHFYFDYLTYLTYGVGGELESADRDAYDQYLEDNNIINPPYKGFQDDLFRGMCQTIDNKIGFLKMQESNLQAWINSQP